MQVKDLTVEELKLLIQESVTETIQSLLNDSDEGKKLKKEVKQILQIISYSTALLNLTISQPIPESLKMPTV